MWAAECPRWPALAERPRAVSAIAGDPGQSGHDCGPACYAPPLGGSIRDGDLDHECPPSGQDGPRRPLIPSCPSAELMPRLIAEVITAVAFR